MSDKIRDEISALRAPEIDGYDETMDLRMDTADTMEKLLAVYEAAQIYRKHMLGEIEPVQACGMRLDEKLAAVKEE